MKSTENSGLMASESKSRADCDFSEPWPLYAGEEKPWTDYDRLLRLNREMDHQYEIADALGTTPSTISYHLQKAEDEHEEEITEEELRCVCFDVCENQTAGPNNGFCDVCLDLRRHNQYLNRKYKTKGVDRDDFDSRDDFMLALYDEYPEYASEQQEVYRRLFEEDDEEQVVECGDCGSEMNHNDESDSYVCSDCGNVSDGKTQSDEDNS